ncbi:MAG TPA: SEC-C domain-containing protein, partial [Acidimicrobiales bacterium]|nr:SEC-C domain-containing protein [Acidimicrobiales bacterium]
TLLGSVLDDDPQMLARALRPLSGLLADLGLDYHAGWVGPPASDWDALDAVLLRRNQVIMAAVGHGLTRAGWDALQLLLAGLEAERSDDEAGRLPGDRAGEALAVEEGVGPALLLLADAEADAAALGAIADRAAAAMRGRQKAAALWLQASCAEARGDYAAQESLLGHAIGAHPGYRPALWDMAWYAADRGQPGRAASLLGSAGAPADDPWRQRLEHYSKPGPNQGPRNEPCKCGSGRKAKSCCLRTNGWPLASRVAWLYDKAAAFVNRPGIAPRVQAVVDVWAEAAGGDHAVAHDLGSDPLPTDLVLFEDGALAEFVERRGPLLPTDEAELAASWVGARLRVCEVLEVRPDEGLVLDDLLSGERLEVVERAATRGMIPHLLILTRVLPDGEGGLQLFGGVRTIPFGRHEGLLEVLAGPPTPAAVAQWLGAASVPPALTNTEGEVQVLGRAVYELDPGTAPDAAAASLSEVLDDEGEGEWAVRGEEQPDGGRQHHGRVVLAGRRLVVEANSEPRLHDIDALVSAAVAGLTRLDSLALPLDAVLLRRLLAGMGERHGHDHAGVDPAAEEFVAQKLRDYEDAWVDEPIPALGGATPRAAVEDDAQRRDLERLLADMEMRGSGMDAGRIRSLLGLSR